MRNNLRTLLSATLLIAALAACGGGGGHHSGGGGNGGGGWTPNPNPTPGPHVWTHSELANEFVRRINAEIVNFDIELVKTWTLQEGYIVVYDWDYGTYDAYYVDAFNPAGDVGDYFNAYEDYTYYDLISEWGGTYYDPITGTRFEKQVADSKNLSKMKAFKEAIAIKKIADKIHADYGLSADKALDVARFSHKLQNSPVGTYNNSDYDAFAKELTGSSITEFQNDFKSGNLISLGSRVKAAADLTGMGPEGVNKLISQVTGM